MQLKHMILATKPCVKPDGSEETLSPLNKLLKCGCIGARTSFMLRKMASAIDENTSAFWATYRDEFAKYAEDSNGQQIIKTNESVRAFSQTIDELAEEDVAFEFDKPKITLTDDMLLSAEELSLLEPFVEFEMCEIGGET